LDEGEIALSELDDVEVLEDEGDFDDMTEMEFESMLTEQQQLAEYLDSESSLFGNVTRFVCQS
jgi:hypothetical protein